MFQALLHRGGDQNSVSQTHSAARTRALPTGRSNTKLQSGRMKSEEAAAARACVLATERSAAVDVQPLEAAGTETLPGACDRGGGLEPVPGRVGSGVLFVAEPQAPFSDSAGDSGSH